MNTNMNTNMNNNTNTNTNTNTYNINISSTLKEKFNDELYIKKLLDQKIEEIKINGFYLDLIESPNFHIDGKDRLNILECVIKNISSNKLPSDFKITDYYKVIGRYIKNNQFHTFHCLSYRNCLIEKQKEDTLDNYNFNNLGANDEE